MESSRSPVTMRVAVYLLLSLAITLMAPALVLLAGPLLLGVPHLLSELRVFARRLTVTRAALLTTLAPLAALVSLRIAEWYGYARPEGSDVVLGCAAVVAASACRPSRWEKRMSQCLVVIGISVLALQHIALTTLLLAHAHNLCALIFFVLWVRPRVNARDVSLLVLVVLAAGGFIWFGAPATANSPFLSNVRLALAPGMTAELAQRVLLAYALAQLMHYAVWLDLLPRVLFARPHAARAMHAPTMRTTDKNTHHTALLLAVCVAVLAVPLYAYLSDPIATREHYLAFASFHGWLELAVLAYCGFGWSARATVPATARRTVTTATRATSNAH